MNTTDYTPVPETGQPSDGMVHVSEPLELVMAQIIQSMKERQEHVE